MKFFVEIHTHVREDTPSASISNKYSKKQLLLSNILKISQAVCISSEKYYINYRVKLF